MGTKTAIDELISEARSRLASGDASGAEAAYRAVLQTAPEQPVVCLELGRLLVGTNRAPAARGLLNVAAREETAGIEARFLAARCEALCGALREAAERFRDLRDMAPNNPDVHAGLIDALERMGDLDAAHAAAVSAVEQFPGNVELAVLAARIERRQEQFEVARTRLEAIDDGAGRPADQAQRFSELGLVLDKLDVVDGAFAAFERANRFFAQVYDRRRIPHGVLQRQIADMARYVAQTDTAALRPLAETTEDWGNLPGSPRFIVGFLRSGTTLLHQMLDARPDVCVIDEKPMALHVRSFVENRPGGYPEGLRNLDRSAAAEARAVYAQALGAEFARSGINLGDDVALVDKFPMNLIRVPMLHRIGATHFLVAYRDPVDVCLSCFMQAFQPSAVTRPFLDLVETARVYAATMSLWLDFVEKAQPAVHIVRYEDLVTGIEAESRALCQFLGLPWDAEMLSFDRHARRSVSVANPSYHQVTKPLYSTAVARWRRYGAHLPEILTVLEPIRSRLGYSER